MAADSPEDPKQMNRALNTPPDFVYPLSDLSGLEVHADRAHPAEFLGRSCLCVENGLVVIGASHSAARIQVDIASPGPSFPGIAFRIADPSNCELAYAQPHCSGGWDALQYDPVFNGSNTWQIYHGPLFQKEVLVPTGEWFTLALEFAGDACSVGLPGQEPLTVSPLATNRESGRTGIWTYLPAYFSNFRVSGPAQDNETKFTRPERPLPHPAGAVLQWRVPGQGVVACEGHGILNLNRYFPLSVGEVTLARSFDLPRPGRVEFDFGLSDDLTLFVDDIALYTTTKPYRPTAGRQGRGYVEFNTCHMSRDFDGGIHNIAVRLKVTEPFGWGLAMAVKGPGLRLLPA